MSISLVRRLWVCENKDYFQLGSRLETGSPSLHVTAHKRAVSTIVCGLLDGIYPYLSYHDGIIAGGPRRKDQETRRDLRLASENEKGSRNEERRLAKPLLISKKDMNGCTRMGDCVDS
jgi:hypothetical protein